MIFHVGKGSSIMTLGFSCYGATPEVLERLYKVIQSLANLVQQYFRLDGTLGGRGGCTTEQLKIIEPPVFKGTSVPLAAEAWIC